MKQQHPIDDLFRSKLENHSVEPPMHLWENIDKSRDREKILLSQPNNRKYRILVGLLFIFGLSVWIFTPSLKPNFTQSKTLVPTEQTININKRTPALNATKNKPSNAGFNKKNTNKASINKIKITANNNTQKTDNQLYTEKVNEQNIAKNKNSFPLKEAKNIPSIHEKNITKQVNLNFPKNKKSVLKKDENKTQTNNNLTQNILSLKIENLIAPIPKNALKLLSFEKGGSLNLLHKETDCPTFNGLPRGLYLDINASIDVAQRMMQSKSIAESDDYLNSRKKTEIPYIAFSTSAHLTALSNRGIAIKTGIDYTQINEFFNYENGHWVRTTIDEIFDDNGVLIGYDTIVKTGIRTIKVVNRYRMLDIPLLLGYELNFSNFSLNAYGGPIFNVVFAKKGAFLSPDDMEPVGLIEGGEPAAFSNAFRNKLGMGWYTSIGFAYKLRKGTQLRFEPYFRVYPKSFTKNDFPIEQKYFLTGIKIGLRQRL